MKNNRIIWAISLILIIYTSVLPLSVGATGAGAAELDFCSQSQNPMDVYEESIPTLADDVRVGSRFWELLFGSDDSGEEEIFLLPGGDVFGVRIKQKRVTVTESRGVPALKSGDVILSINGEEVGSAGEIKSIIENSAGESLTIRALHKGNEIAVEVRPTLEDGKYRLGLVLRDSAAGLGTITFIDPKTGRFGGLGHGICDADSGEVIEMEGGDVCGVILGGIHKGENGKPGELYGVLTDRDLGDVDVNCECGVFGVMSNIPSSQQTVSIGRRDDVTEGEATILSTLKNGKTAEYKIEIYDVDHSSEGSKSFRIRITDETLKALTGGIVRGMSGSPIIQNGRLIGAVTHVLVADPTEGYGIFIENMLNVSKRLDAEYPAA